MNKDLSQVEFCFPAGGFKNKGEIADSIISLMKNTGSVDYSGYADAGLLRQGLLDHIGNGNAEKYKEISENQKTEIEKIISETIEKCNEMLPVPIKNFIFVHPYLPAEGDEVFDGVMAVAVYSCVFHLFVNLEQYTKKSLENTVAHELNHTIYYYHHYDDFNNYTLLDEILLEGLAENFREQYFDPNITEWANALNKEEAFDILKTTKGSLESRDHKLIKDFLFGNDEYKKWTGYSVGYWLVKVFKEQKSDLSWDDMVRLNPKDFLEVAK
jgi:uncharacterized protein YjaZ